MTEIYIRNIIFGIADSLVSTIGLLSGIDAGGTNRSVIILVGVVYAFVEALSMAVGSFLSEESAEDYKAKGETSDRKPYISGIVMFVSFALTAFIPLSPYFFLDLSSALWLSITLSIVALFVVGMIIAKISRTGLVKHALKTAFLGGAAIIIGVMVGKFIKTGY